MDDAAAEVAFRCPRCGSEKVRRSRTRSGLEELIRTTSPLRPYVCRGCGHRGWHSGPVGRRRARDGARTGSSPGRRTERRDVLAAARRRRRTVAVVIVVAVLGILASLVFVM